MKLIIPLTILLSVTCSVYAAKGGFESGEKAPAAHEQDAGYKGTEDTGQNRVSTVRTMKAGDWVTLEGNILREKSPGQYDFRDKSGTLGISIAPGVWKERKYDAADLVRISGRIQGTGDNATLHVERLDEP